MLYDGTLAAVCSCMHNMAPCLATLRARSISALHWMQGVLHAASVAQVECLGSPKTFLVFAECYNHIFMIVASKLCYS